MVWGLNCNGEITANFQVGTRDVEVTLEDGLEGGVKWAVKPASSAEIGALLDAVRSGKFRTQRELAEHLKMEPSKVTRLKARAFGKGEIRGLRMESVHGR